MDNAPRPSRSPPLVLNNQAVSLHNADDWNSVPQWHQFCAAMIGLFVELVITAPVSQRGASQSLAQILNRLFGKQLRIPCANTGRLWVLRLGLYELTRPKEKADDWVWIVDHTIQISSVKCLLIVGCRLSRWEQNRRPLRHTDLEVFALEPVEKSSGEIVCEQFKQTAKIAGVPRAIVSDGGADLQRGMAFYRELYPEVASCYDIVHKTALFLKKALAKDERWQEFLKKMASSKKQSARSPVAFLAPPLVPDQARYMNLKGLLSWARGLLDFMKDPQKNNGTLAEPWHANFKFKWILEFEADLAEWQCMLDIVETTLHFVRWEGYFPGAESHLKARLAPLVGFPSADRLIEKILEFIAEQSQSARSGERLIGSSECIESLIGKAKRLEGQQSRSGFTAMILGVAAAVVEPTRDVIDAALAIVKTNDVKNWARNALGKSVQACRRLALKDPLKEQKRDKLQPLAGPGF